MLDRLFISKLNKTGKILYFVGQLVLLGLIALIMFGALGVDFDEGYSIFISAVIVSVIAWGGQDGEDCYGYQQVFHYYSPYNAYS